MTSKSPIKGLGEIALQVNDLVAMQAFYEDVVGLRLLRRFEDSAFFAIAEGAAGHTQVLALFDRTAGDKVPLSYRRPPLDHIAFEIELEDYAAELARLTDTGIDVKTSTHAWTQWRSIYVTDPEGNIVEWVCYDATIGDDQ
ncbi:MAG: VOC family protein [Chloroflexia bacterium]|jgi:catechol 2,3-dioxygenase|nr:VOC family protein [Chloroflexia bacterium]